MAEPSRHIAGAAGDPKSAPPEHADGIASGNLGTGRNEVVLEDHGDGIERGPQNGNVDEGVLHHAQTAKKRNTDEEKKQEKPSKLKELCGKIGLDVGTALMMFKGSVAPTIAIAIYQSDSVSSTFSTLGYLVPIISVLSLAIMPRAKYLQTLVLNTIGICVGSAISLLGIWSGIQARHNTAPPGFTGYNSSQAAVCAIWLFANIWFVNVLRAKLPALQFPVIMYSIFTNVAFTFGPLLPTIASGESLIKQLLESFLTAFGISTAVNLFIIPVTSRTVVFSGFSLIDWPKLEMLTFLKEEQSAYLGLIRQTLKAQAAYLESLESSDMFAPKTASIDKTQVSDRKKQKKDAKKTQNDKSNKVQTAEAKALKDCISGLTTLHGKLYGDIPFAKREAAFGKLDAKDIDQISELFRNIMIPLVGISTITDIFERIAERRGWIPTDDSVHDRSEKWDHSVDSEKEEEKRVWNEVMKTLHEPFALAAAAMDQAMEHAGLVLELLPKPKKKKGDVEAEGSCPKPGHHDFSKDHKQKMLDFYSNRGKTIRAWAREKGLSQDHFEANKAAADLDNWKLEGSQHRRDQQQLYLILFLENLLYSTGVAIWKLVEFADKKAADGSMKKKRLILPGYKRLKKWLFSIGKEDTSVDTDSPDSMEAGNHHIYMGAGFNPRKDPEHLPAANAWEKFGNGLRTIPRFLGSVESAFGFRVALATMTIGIVAFLEASQRFFNEQRLVWAMIIIAIGMTMTSGQSMFGFFARVAGTAIAMVISLVIWYIVNEETAGVIVMLWFFIFLEMFFFIKFPRFIPIWLVAIVTQVLIVGYELQVRKIGIKASTASGQPYYPIYQLGPYRLACVAAGSFVAFIWTIFPYPLSDRSWLRKDLGSTLYLLANYYSVVHSTIVSRLHNTEGDKNLKHSPGRRLEKVRHKTFGKLLLLLPSLAQHAEWQRWELSIGGKFPRKTYENITLRATNIMRYLSLMSYATQSWSEDDGTLLPSTRIKDRRHWLEDLTKLVDQVWPTSYQATSTLSLLSASIKGGVALPPYIHLPQPYDLSHRLNALDKGILDARHIEEPGYAAYAVMQVASSLVLDDLRRMVEAVKDLVGETDFSFEVPLSDSSIDSSGPEGSGGKGKRD